MDRLGITSAMKSRARNWQDMVRLDSQTSLSFPMRFNTRDEMNWLANKVAIVTGAISGIGGATALLFASEGAAVIVGARRKHELETLLDEITKKGAHAISVAGDVGDEAHGEFGVHALQRLPKPVRVKPL